MAQSERLAVMKDVPIISRKEDCVRDTVQRGRLAVTKDVPNMPRREEFVKDMVQRRCRVSNQKAMQA